MRRLLFNLKITFKNKGLIFWTFAFPIILGTLFYAAFSNIKTQEEIDPIKVAIVVNDDNPLYPVYSNILDNLKNEDKNLLETSYYESRDEAAAQIGDDNAVGVIVFETDTDYPKFVVEKSEFDQTIVQNVLTEIEQAMVVGRPFEMPEIKNTYERDFEFTMIEYYSLFAMACLYGGMIATKALDKNLANMTASGKRIAVASVSKTKIILGSLFTSYVTQLVGLALLFVWMTLVLKIDFGANLPYIIMYTALGALLGLALGTFVSAVFKVKENSKDGILTAVTMIGCFFAGMMGPTMKYIADTNMSFINKINPAAIITDGYYALSTYGPNERFFSDILSILICCAILSAVSIFVLRRQKYDNL